MLNGAPGAGIKDLNIFLQVRQSLEMAEAFVDGDPRCASVTSLRAAFKNRRPMFAFARSFLLRHPLVRDALLWAVPAIVFGAALRLLLLSYMPHAYWGSDSRSYFSFAHKFIAQGGISLDEKRRFLYPIFLVPIAALPGETLRWLAWIQHGIGLITLVPLAYIARKTFWQWRLWIIPITLIYAGMPMIFWYEHELLGENIFFATLLCAFAGWVAWVNEPRLERSRRLFWCFFVPFSLFILTKPSGRFVWPGILAGLLLTGVWRRLDWRRFTAIGILMIVTLTVGSKKQAAWLLYVATFPLTQLDSPKHADFKAEIRADVEPLHRNLSVYYLKDGWVFEFLERPTSQEERPLWKSLDDIERRSRLYMDLAIEGIKAEPVNFLYFAVQRLIDSANPSQFKETRFEGENYVTKFEHFYEDAQEREKSPVRMLFALPKTGPLPPYPEFQKRLSPAPNGWAAHALQAYVRGYEAVSDLFRMPDSSDVEQRQIIKTRLTPLGWWLAAACLLSLLPRYRAALGIWMIIAFSYLIGVFLVSQVNPRYFGAAWLVLVPLLAVPADVFVSMAAGALRLKRQTALKS